MPYSINCIKNGHSCHDVILVTFFKQLELSICTQLTGEQLVIDLLPSDGTLDYPPC